MSEAFELAPLPEGPQAGPFVIARHGAAQLGDGVGFGSARLQRGDRSLDVTASLVEDAGQSVLLRDGAVETFVPAPHGYEQRWAFAERPVGNGPIVVRIAAEGLTPRTADASGLHFATHDAEVTYGHATWIDADGVRIPVPAELVEGGVRLVVPEAVVDGSAYPAVLDPNVTAEFSVQVRTGFSAGHVMETGGTDGTDFLVLWSYPDVDEKAWYASAETNAGVIAAAKYRLPVTGDRAWVLDDGTGYLVVTTQAQRAMTLRVGRNGAPLESSPVVFPVGSPVKQAVFAFGKPTLLVGDEVITLGADRLPGPVVATHAAASAIAARPDALFLYWDGPGSGLMRVDAAGSVVSQVDFGADKAVALAVMTPTSAGVVLIGSRQDLPQLTPWVIGSYYSVLVRDDGSATAPVKLWTYNDDDLVGGVNGCGFVGTRLACAYTSYRQGGIRYIGLKWLSPDGARELRYDPLFTVPGWSANGSLFAVTATHALVGASTAYPSTDTFVRSFDTAVVTGTISPIPLRQVPVDASPSGAQHLVLYANDRSGESGLRGTHVLDGQAGRGTNVALSTTYLPARFARVFGVAAGHLVRDGASVRMRGVDFAGVVTDLGGASGSDRLVATSPGSVLFVSNQAGQRRSLDGTAIDTSPFALGVATTYGSVAAWNGSGFLVGGLTSATNAAPFAAQLQVVPGSGPVTMSPITLGADASRLAIACGGTACLVVWTDSLGTHRGVVDASGTLVSRAPLPEASYERFALAFDGTQYVLAYEVERAILDRDIVGIRLDETGALLDATPFVIAGSSVDERRPVLSSRGNGLVLVAYASASLPSPLHGAPRANGRWIGTPVVAPRCTSASQCASGFCVDGVCCDSACGGDVTTDCLACSLARGALVDGACGVAYAGISCRPQNGTCDVAESCDGSSATCPADRAQADGIACSDGNACTRVDRCSAGSCVGDSPVTCTATNACRDVGVCNPSTGVCSSPNRPDGAACSDSNACTRADACSAGTCVGSDPVTCTPSAACRVAACDRTTGACVETRSTVGTACDDGNPCTSNERCDAAGACTNGFRTQCPGAPCKNGECDPATGGCVSRNWPDGTACGGDGFSACSTNNRCQGGTCVGTPVSCAGPCLTGACDAMTGCVRLGAGTACDDGNRCTATSTCGTRNALWGCWGPDPLAACPPPPPCRETAACDAATGECTTAPLADGVACDDGLSCTSPDRCVAGTCVGASTCAPAGPCQAAGRCEPGGGCTYDRLPELSSCDDGNPCTTNDQCIAGECAGAPSACTSADPCRVPSCDPVTGACSTAPGPDGVACDDRNACTAVDRCLDGRCVGVSAVACTPSGTCHVAGTCDPTTGRCTDPIAPDGAACDDGNACTQTDACAAGACLGGSPVTCAARDACHLVGECDPASGTCSNPTAPDSTPCDDGSACTRRDACSAGLCRGEDPVPCRAPDTCHGPGTCDPSTGSCTPPPLADGTSCDDGDRCTLGDACVRGSCLAGAPVTCPGEGACLAGACSAVLGACVLTPLEDGTRCPGGACFAGVCDLDPVDVDAGSPDGIDAGTPEPVDAGEPEDAGRPDERDAGAVPDRVDAGALADDAGGTATFDAGHALADAGPAETQDAGRPDESDAGPEPDVVDASVPVFDAGEAAASDAGPAGTPDAGREPAGPDAGDEPEVPVGGCQCGTGSAGTLAWAGLSLLARRRRRRVAR